MRKSICKRSLFLLISFLWVISPIYSTAQNLADSRTLQAEQQAVGQPESVLGRTLKIRKSIKGLEPALAYIERATGAKFVYRQEVVEAIKNVGLNRKNGKTTIKKLLKSLFKNSDVRYEVSDNFIILTTGKDEEAVLGISNKVSGIVKESSSGKSLPGVNIVVKNGTAGAFSDKDGKYSLTVPSLQDTLIFSFIGYQRREVPVRGRSVINVKMKKSTSKLSETIVTSTYGTAQKRSDLVSSAYEVTSEDIAELPQQRVDKLLEGIVPGLQYTSQSDQATSARPRHSVTVRGEASLSASNEPLWIVDGTRIDTGGKTNLIRGLRTSVSPLSYIDPQNIKSITVLKDASATSLYGADGANGVILVKTKSGQRGNLKLDVSLRQGVSKINRATSFKVLNGPEYLKLAKEAYKNAGKDMKYFPFKDNDLNDYSHTNNDWYDTFYDMGKTSQINLSASGGSESMTYYVSGGYYRDQKTVKGNTQQRLSLRTKENFDMNNKMDLDLTLGGSYNINSLFTPGSDYYENRPVISPYNPDGSFRQYYEVIDGKKPNGNPNYVKRRFFNSVAEREQNDNDQTAFALQGNLKFSYEPIENVSYTGQFGTDYRNTNENVYQSMKNWSGYNLLTNEAVGKARWTTAKYIGWNMIHRINFEEDFGKHNLSGVGGLEMSSSKNTIVGSYGSGFLNDHLRAVSYASNTTGSSNEYIDRKMSYFGQLSYSYDERYNLILNGRKDGNSNFGEDVRWADFASIGASWNIYKEDFFHSHIFNVVRIKGSYGSNGNSRIGSQEAQGVYSINEQDRYAGEPGASMSKGPNPDLSWETTYMTNLGVRVAAFDSRIDLSVEVYRNKTKNLLSNLDVSRTTGNRRVYRNVGSIKNEGIEVTLNTVNVETKDFSWHSKVLASSNRNEILELYNNIPKNFNRKRWEEGEDTNTYYLVRWAGVDSRDGAPLWYDARGNITRVYSAANRVASKNSTPDVYGSITNTFNYKSFSLRLQANYTIGGYAFSSFGRDVSSDGLHIMDGNQSVNQLDRWQGPGDIAQTPKLLWGISTESVRNSTRYLYRKTNINLQNIALSYRLPSKKANSAGLKGMTVSLVGNNLGIWTPYDQSNRNSYRNNISGYPDVRSVSLSVNVSF